MSLNSEKHLNYPRNPLLLAFTSLIIIRDTIKKTLMKQLLSPLQKSLLIASIATASLSPLEALTTLPPPVQTNFLHSKEHLASEFQEMYQIGLDALQQEDYLRAKAAFSSILRHHRQFLKVNRGYYFSAKINLAVCESNLGNFKEADLLLNRLRKENPPEKALITIESFRARLKHKKGEVNEAFLILYNLQKRTNQTLWEQEELSFFQEIEHKLDQNYQDLVSQAEKMYHSSLFDLAIPLYSKVALAIEKGHFPQELREGQRYEFIMLKLANCYYQNKEYTQALRHLQQVKDSEHELFPEKTFLEALCYQSLGKHDEALANFEGYLRLGSPRDLPRFAQAKLQLGISNFQNGKLAPAQRHFNFFNKPGNTQEKFLAKLYLAKIFLAEKRSIELDKELSFLEKVIEKDNPLFFEFSYLKGESLFLKENYPQAIEAYELSIPEKNKEQAKWYLSTLYNLAWCYLQLANDHDPKSPQQLQLFSKAELILNELISHKKTPEAALALARLYLAQDMQSEKVEHLLANTSFSDNNEQAEALYLRARATEDKQKQQQLYEKLSDEIYLDSPYYGMAWFSQGVYFFDEAQKRSSEEGVQEKKLYEKSIHFLNKAFKFLKEKDSEKAALAIKYSIYAYHYLDSKEAKYQALSLIKQLFNNYSEAASLLPNKDEILYLEASIAASLLEETQNLPFLSTIEKAKDKILELAPQGPYADKVLYLSAVINFQLKKYELAEEDFTSLATNYPSSPHLAEALFWLAETSEWLERDPKTIKSLRQRVFTNFPEANFAAEAYFNFYSFAEYLQGEDTAYKHLQKMPQLFPRSNFSIVAHYLIGLQHKQENLNQDIQVSSPRNLQAAFTAFEHAKDLFVKNYDEQLIPDTSIAYFADIYFKSFAELPSIRNIQAFHALGTQKRVFLEQASTLYQDFIQELENPEGLYSKHISSDSLSPTLEESLYELAKLYLESKQDELAESQFVKLQRQQQASGKTHSYFGSRVWYHLGEIKKNRREYKEALNCFLKSESTATHNTISTEKKLKLWLEIARCHQQLDQLDEAMLALSKVINEFVSSELRVEAMFLRALIYEQQGKRDFAIKQLESTSKKTGEWAAKAQDKLRQDYGFQ